VGKIAFRTARAVERFHVGLELNEIPADETRGEAEMARQLAKQPCGIAARTARKLERFLRRLHARLEADQITDVFPKLLIERDEEIYRARARIVRSSRREEALPFVPRAAECVGRMRRMGRMRSWSLVTSAATRVEQVTLRVAEIFCEQR